MLSYNTWFYECATCKAILQVELVATDTAMFVKKRSVHVGEKKAASGLSNCQGVNEKKLQVTRKKEEGHGKW